MPDAGLILRAVNVPGQNVERPINLQPVIADNIEIGTAWRRDGFDLSARYFWSNSNLGSRIQVLGGAGVVHRERTEIKGVELAGRDRVPTGQPPSAALAQIHTRVHIDQDG